MPQAEKNTSPIEAFQTHVLPVAGSSEWDAAVARCWVSACAAWPQINVDAAIFGAFLAERVQPEAPVETLASLHVKELLLTCAAANGDPLAIRLIEFHYFP